MDGFILTKGFQVRPVVATPIPERPGYVMVGKRKYREDFILTTARQAVERGEWVVAKQRSELARRQAELDARSVQLAIARARLL